MIKNLMNSGRIEILGKYGAILSMIEVGLGSFLHTLKVPFIGYFLSLNQGYLLCRLVMTSTDIWAPYNVSNIAAVLKSLSPSGQKFGPMLSLSMQGLLFNIGTILFGPSLLGLALGMVLLSVWSFIQPVLTYYLFFGSELFLALEFLYKKTFPYHGLQVETLKIILIGMIVLKFILAIGLAVFAFRTKGKSQVQDRFMDTPQYHSKPLLRLLLKDLTAPLFIISLLLTTLFLYHSQKSPEEIIWYLLRPLAVGFLFYYFSRTLTLDRWLEKLSRGPFQNFALSCQEALKNLRKVL